MDYVTPEFLSLKKHPTPDEKWLLARIAEDPSMLGLGDIVLKDKERIQPGAGRLDLLLQDPETLRRYEVEIQLGRLRTRLADRRIGLDIDEAAMAQLAREGYDPAFGARPLKRVIQREIADPASLLILEGDVVDGGTIAVRAGAAEGEGLRVTATGAG